MSWHLFDRIRSLARSANIYQQERLFQDQSSLERIMAGGELLDFSQQQALLDQTNLQINRLERYKDYDQMDEMGEISLALDLYADEASLVDPERKHTLVIKAQSNVVKQELEDLFFDQLLIDNMVRPMVRYLCKYGDSPFEIVPTVNRDGVASLKFVNVYNFTRVETKHGDLVGFFHQDEVMEEPQFLHPWQVMHLRLTDFGNIYHPYGKCQPLSTPVNTPSGWKRLGDIKPGDLVYSWDGEKAIETRVVAAVNNGVKDTYNIKTRHYEINVTPEHPVLVHENGEESYKLAHELKVGDKLIIPEIEFPDKLIPIKKRYRRYTFNEEYRGTLAASGIGYKKCANDLDMSPDVTRSFLRRGGSTDDTKSSMILDYYGLPEKARIGSGWGTWNDCDLPEYVDDEFARFMGFLMGDGWISSNSVQFALGEDNDLNEFYIGLLEKYSGDSKITYRYNRDNKPVAAIANSIVLADTLYGMGLNAKANYKTIPQWVFESTKDVAISFVQGLLDADGCAYLDRGKYLRFYHTTSSEDLAIGLKILLSKLGVKCGLINKGVNKKFNSNETGNLRYQLTYSNTEMSYANGRVCERITRIGAGPTTEVGDIQVESDYHNFIANGVVVHNSIVEGGRKAFKQLRLMEDAALIYRITRAPEKRVFKVPIGNIPAKDVPEFIQQVARTFKKQRFYDPRTGQFNERFSPLIQEDDFFMPVRPDGTSPSVDILKGAENLDQIADIEYFKKKMVAPTKVPFKRVGIGDGAGEEQEKSLASTDSQFAKSVQWVQREVSIGLTKVAICHLAMAGYNIEDLKSFEISMCASSAIDELYRIETWQGRTAVMGELKDLGWFPVEWIVTRFTDLSPDEIKELTEIMQEQQDQFPDDDDMPGMGMGMGLPGMEDEDLPEIEGEEEPGLEDFEAEMGEAGAEAEAEGELGDLGERLDKRSGRLLKEIRRSKRNRQMLELVDKLGTTNVRSKYDNLISNNELGGLETKTETKNKVLIESNIDETMTESVIHEYKRLMTISE